MQHQEIEPETVVVFRKFSDGQVIALLPREPSDCDSWINMTSYMHIGQHGSASPRIVYETKLATPEEYADLKAELESPPYCYRLKVQRRISSADREARKDEWLRFKALE